MRPFRLPSALTTSIRIGFILLGGIFISYLTWAADLTTSHYLIDYEGVQREEVIPFGQKADRAYEIVKTFIGDLPQHEFLRVDPVHLFIRPDFRIPRTLIFLWRGQNRIEFPVHRVTDGHANLIHETTHSLAPSRNRFLAEGLAVYLEERFGNLRAFPTFGKPVATLLCEFKNQGHLISLSNLLKETKDNPTIFTRRYGRTVIQRTAYLEGGALVKLLLEEDDRFGPTPDVRKKRFFQLFNEQANLSETYQTSPGALERYLVGRHVQEEEVGQERPPRVEDDGRKQEQVRHLLRQNHLSARIG